MNKKIKVLNYLNNNLTTPLNFGKDFDYNDFIRKSKKYTLDEFVLECLKNARNYGSYDKNNDQETRCYAYRSALDIWRHVIYFKPEVTIFNVMSILYNNQIDLGGLFCWDVKRRVFYNVDREEDDDGNYIDDAESSDEFGFPFFEWEDIDKD